MDFPLEVCYYVYLVSKSVVLWNLSNDTQGWNFLYTFVYHVEDSKLEYSFSVEGFDTLGALKTLAKETDELVCEDISPLVEFAVLCSLP